MLTGMVLVCYVLALSPHLVATMDAPSEAANTDVEQGFMLSTGERLVRLVKVGMTEGDVRAIFGRERTPLRISFGTVSDTTLLTYPEFGVSVAISIGGRVAGVERNRTKDQIPPPPVGVGHVTPHDTFGLDWFSNLSPLLGSVWK